ncbi:MAG: hypothetical protein DWQ05_13625 [Calditrichaeota bacterium]|nr:MAG: hypothetical protein DWQ05_13625 [Calditrichota bacterium]
MYCHHCQSEISVDLPVRRQETCPKCSSYLHCCKNCRFYDLHAPQQCKEPIAELVSNKESGNFCGYFEPASEKPAIDKSAEEARKKLDELFKKK